MAITAAEDLGESKDADKYFSLKAERDHLKAQLALCVDALEFYANEKNYTNDGIVFVTTYYGDYMNPPEQEQDYGCTAQKTLAKLSDTDNQSTPKDDDGGK